MKIFKKDEELPPDIADAGDADDEELVDNEEDDEEDEGEDE